jgi:hypothetical protein
MINISLTSSLNPKYKAITTAGARRIFPDNKCYLAIFVQFTIDSFGYDGANAHLMVTCHA